MTEKDSKNNSEQDDVAAEMILSLQALKQEAEILTQSMNLPMEVKYDLLATTYHQLPFFYAETALDHSLQESLTKLVSFPNGISSCPPITNDLLHNSSNTTQEERLNSDLFAEKKQEKKECIVDIEQEDLHRTFPAQNTSDETIKRAIRALHLYPFQQRVYSTITSGRNIILHAPTGSGKTCAALLPFITNLAQGGENLPLTCRYVVPQHVLANQLYHKYQFLDETFEQLMGISIQKNNWQLRNKTVAIQTSDQHEDPQMNTTLTFCTSDQLFANFLNVPPNTEPQEMNPTVAGVLSSYLILDEFHLYSLCNNEGAFSERMAILQMLRLLKRTTPFILMTATVSSTLLQRLQTLLDAEVISVMDKQELVAIKQGRKRTFWRSETPMNMEIILAEHYQRSANRCTLVVCNTIEHAQHFYLQLKRTASDGLRIILFHNLFTTEDRQAISQEIEEELGVDKWHNGTYSGRDLIVVTTQVIEVGFDISVQVMHTEIAPASSLIQRAGRCGRFAQQQGQVWIYPIHQSSEGNASSTPPYSQALCATTWDALKAFHAQEVGFLQEQELINTVHTQEDERFIDLYERSESQTREQILASLITEDCSASSPLLQSIAHVQILIQDNPGSTIQEKLWQWESFSVNPRWLMAHWQALQERATQLDLPVCWEPAILEKWSGSQRKAMYMWQPVTTCEMISQALVLAFPRQLARYDNELGFILLDGQSTQELGTTDYQSRQVLVHTSNDKEHRLYQSNHQNYRRDLLQTYNMGISKEIHYVAARLEQEIGLEQGIIDKTIKQALVSHYSGQQEQTWQQWTQTVLEILAETHQGSIWENIDTPNTPTQINYQRSLETWLYFLIGRALLLSSLEAA